MTGISEENKQVIDDFFAKNSDPNRPTDQIVCIIDRSGSMGSIRADAEGGFNEFVRQQREVPGDAELTLVEFDSQVDYVYNRTNLDDVKDYKLVPRGATALNDAIGQTLNDALSWELDPNTKVIVTIVTDGGENSSREYDQKQVFDLIDQCKEKGWEVVFLAANQDAMQTGSGYGIGGVHTMDWNASAEGTRSMYSTAHVNATMYRTGNKMAGEGIRDYEGKSIEDIINEKAQNDDDENKTE